METISNTITKVKKINPKKDIIKRLNELNICHSIGVNKVSSKITNEVESYEVFLLLSQKDHLILKQFGFKKKDDNFDNDENIENNIEQKKYGTFIHNLTIADKRAFLKFLRNGTYKEVLSNKDGRMYELANNSFKKYHLSK